MREEIPIDRVEIAFQGNMFVLVRRRTWFRSGTARSKFSQMFGNFGWNDNLDHSNILYSLFVERQDYSGLIPFSWRIQVRGDGAGAKMSLLEEQ